MIPPRPPTIGGPAPAATAELLALLAPDAVPLHAHRRPRGPGHRPSPTLGPRRSLKALLAEEVTGRERSALATRRTAAGFPTGKTFDAWQPRAPSIPAPTQQALRTLEWVTAARTSSSADPPGPGRRSCSKPSASRPSRQGCASPGSPWKTSACCCAGTAPTTPSPKPSPGSCAPTGRRRRHRAAAGGPDAAEGLYRLVDAAYEKRSIAISSNLHPAGFDELMPKTLATATVDRLLHHAHVCQTSGDSVRLTQALAGKGVSPLH
jgi:hypothetical protein